MKKTLVLAVTLVAIFTLSATKRPAHPVCGPFITFHNSLSPGITITSVDISGPGAGSFTTPAFTTSYSTSIGTFSPTFVIHFSAAAPSGTACLSDDITGDFITGVHLTVGASSITVTVTSPTLTCSDYTLTISRAPDCPLPR